MPFQTCACRVSRRVSGAAVADDLYPGTKHNSALGSSSYELEEMENKTDRSRILWD